MRGRLLCEDGGDTSERRTLAVVMTVVCAAVLTMLWLAPGEQVEAALMAGVGEVASRDMRADVATVAPDEPVIAASLDSLLQREELMLPPLPSLHDARFAGLVNDLRDDGIPGNALRAMRILVQQPPGDIAELQAALDTYDPQLRHFAAGILRRRCDAHSATV